MEEENKEELITNSLMHSYWKQAFDYFIEMDMPLRADQLDWVYENEPEQFYGYSMWLARELDNIPDGPDYGVITKIVNILSNDFLVNNDRYFKNIQEAMERELVDLPENSGKYLILKLEKLMVGYYKQPTEENFEILNDFILNPISEFDFIEDLEINEEALESLIEILDKDTYKIQSFLSMYEWFKNDFSKEEREMVTAVLNKAVEQPYDLSGFDNIVFARYQFIDQIKINHQ